MKTLDQLTRPDFSWFDLVFIVVAFTIIRDLTTGLLQTACFIVVGAVVAAEQVFLRPRIVARAQQATRGQP